jgi:integrase
MGTVKLAYVDAFLVRGVWRYYFRRSRKHKRIPLPGRPGDAEFMRAYERALSESGPSKPSHAGTLVAGSFDALAAAYYGSAGFLILSPNTRTTYRGIIERFLASTAKNGRRHGELRIAGMKSRNVRDIIDDKFKSSGPWAANNLLKVLRQLLEFAVAHDWCADNPTKGIKPIKAHTDGFRSWSEENIEQFENYHASGTRARLALALLLYTSQRRSDIVRMGRQHVGKGAKGKPTIRVRQDKTKETLAIPMHHKLRAEIAAHSAINNLTFLLTSRGKPFSAASFGNWFREVCDEAGLQGLSAHGLRKAAARRMAEAGCTPHQIMSVTGHKSLAEVARYTFSANQERMANEAMDRIEPE